MKIFFIVLLTSCSSVQNKQEKESSDQLFVQNNNSSSRDLSSFVTPEGLVNENLSTNGIKTENAYFNWNPLVKYTLPQKLAPGRYGVWFTIGKTIPPKSTDLKVFLNSSGTGYSQEYTNAFLSIPNTSISLDKSLVLIVKINSSTNSLDVSCGAQLKRYLSQTYKKSVNLTLKLYRIPEVTIRQVANINPLQLVLNQVQKIEIPDLLIPIKN